MDTKPTTDIIRQMAESCREQAKRLDYQADTLDESGDFTICGEVISGINNTVNNMRLDLLVVRPLREYERERISSERKDTPSQYPKLLSCHSESFDQDNIELKAWEEIPGTFKVQSSLTRDSISSLRWSGSANDLASAVDAMLDEVTPFHFDSVRRLGKDLLKQFKGSDSADQRKDASDLPDVKDTRTLLSDEDSR